MAPRSSLFAFAVSLGGLLTRSSPVVRRGDRPGRKPLIGEGSKWHRRMVASGRK